MVVLFIFSSLISGVAVLSYGNCTVLMTARKIRFKADFRVPTHGFKMYSLSHLLCLRLSPWFFLFSANIFLQNPSFTFILLLFRLLFTFYVKLLSICNQKRSDPALLNNVQPLRWTLKFKDYSQSWVIGIIVQA